MDEFDDDFGASKMKHATNEVKVALLRGNKAARDWFEEEKQRRQAELKASSTTLGKMRKKLDNIKARIANGGNNKRQRLHLDSNGRMPKVAAVAMLLFVSTASANLSGNAKRDNPEGFKQEQMLNNMDQDGIIRRMQVKFFGGYHFENEQGIEFYRDVKNNKTYYVGEKHEATLAQQAKGVMNILFAKQIKNDISK